MGSSVITLSYYATPWTTSQDLARTVNSVCTYTLLHSLPALVRSLPGIRTVTALGVSQVIGCFMATATINILSNSCPILPVAITSFQGFL